MAICKRKGSKIWYIRFTSPGGRRIQLSSGTDDKQAAQRLHDKLKNDMWRQESLGERPRKTWQEAAIRWMKEQSHKKTLGNDALTFKWLQAKINHLYLDQLDRELIERIADEKKETGVTETTVNRMLETIRAVLRKAHADWEWLDKVPKIRMRVVDKVRIRWITHAQAERLIAALPPHLSEMAAFSLATGLRKSNVTGLKWSAVDLAKRHAYVEASESKTKKAIPVPLNRIAMDILRHRLANKEDSSHEYVFTYKGRPVRQTNTKAWKKGLAKAGIKNFRWHDMRHTWASWHIQNGTTTEELQKLGGWRSPTIVLRYAHLSGQQMKKAAERICGENLVQFRV